MAGARDPLGPAGSIATLEPPPAGPPPTVLSTASPPNCKAEAGPDKPGRTDFAIKPIAQLLWETPVFSPQQLAVARHVAERYRGAVGPLLSRTLPPGVPDRRAGFLEPTGERIEALASLGERWPQTGELLAALGRGASVAPEELALALPAAEQEAFARALAQSGVARRAVRAERKAPCTEGATQPPSSTASAAAGQGPDGDGESEAHAGSLVARATRQTLSAIFADVANRRGDIFLVHGSPAISELVLQIARRCLSRRRQVVVIVPDVRAIRRLVPALRAGLPPGEVATLHGRMSSTDRRSAWQAMLSRAPGVVVGAHMAMMAPLGEPGAVIVLDEHSDLHKNGRTPRYHTRDVALWFARQHGAFAVLVSPSPDPATLWRAKRGAFRYVDLRGMADDDVAARGGGHAVDVLDMRHELRVANTSLISRRLHASLTDALRRGDQAILLLNRRGTNTQLICARCGYLAQCRGCSVALTYHAEDAALVCHYCNARYAVLQMCPNCPSRRLSYLGAGTHRVEQELRERFPGARIARLDRDSSRGPTADRATARCFANGDIDLIIGTKLLATRGLLPPAQLVAVLNADVTLHFPDYRAAQATYEMLRGIDACVRPDGRLLIQTYGPEHWAIQAIAQRSPALFYREELRQRRVLGYPPFTHIARLLWCHANAERCRAEAESLAARLEERRAELRLATAAVVGPAPAYLERLRGKSRWQIFLRGHGFAPLLDVVPRGWTVDIDPVSTL